MKKFLILFITAFVGEIIITFYINGISEKNTLQSMFFAFITPFLNIPSISYLIDAKGMKERAIIACFSGSGYCLASLCVMSVIK